MSNQNDKTVWHYTSLDVLEKIFLENEPRMLATHFRNFSDTDEIVRGASVLLDELEEEPALSDPYYCNFLRCLVNNRYRDNYYILSFCREKDHFCQWVNYANKHGVGGCAIGFKQDLLVRMFVHIIDTADHGKDSYVPEFNQLLSCEYIDDTKPIKDIIREKLKNYNCEELVGPLRKFKDLLIFSQLLFWVLSLKTTRFDYEKEQRLLLRYRKPAQYIENNPYPYLSDNNQSLYCPFDRKLISDTCVEIMLAPNSDEARGRTIVDRINKSLATQIQVTKGKAIGKGCVRCHRYATLLKNGVCSA